jgi:hypothetical protein
MGEPEISTLIMIATLMVMVLVVQVVVKKRTALIL